MHAMRVDRDIVEDQLRAQLAEQATAQVDVIARSADLEAANQKLWAIGAQIRASESRRREIENAMRNYEQDCVDDAPFADYRFDNFGHLTSESIDQVLSHCRRSFGLADRDKDIGLPMTSGYGAMIVCDDPEARRAVRQHLKRGGDWRVFQFALDSLVDDQKVYSFASQPLPVPTGSPTPIAKPGGVVEL